MNSCNANQIINITMLVNESIPSATKGNLTNIMIINVYFNPSNLLKSEIT